MKYFLMRSKMKYFLSRTAKPKRKKNIKNKENEKKYIFNGIK
jgi:hypothetical protein